MFDFLLFIASIIVVAYVWIEFILDYLRSHPKLRKFEFLLVFVPPLVISISLALIWKGAS